MELRDNAQIAMVAEKIIKAMQAPMKVRVRDVDIELSIKPSIGIAVLPKDGTTVDMLIGTADAAMYEAKRSKSGYAFAR